MSTREDFLATMDTLGVKASETQGFELTQTMVASLNPSFTQRLSESLPQLKVGGEAEADFMVTRHLGAGGMGLVRLAEQRALGREVAVKSLRPELEAPEEVSALLQEARAMGYVEHPNIVPVHMIGRDERGAPVIVMKRIDGEPWERWVGEAPEGEDPVAFHVNVAISLCRALSYAHSQGVLHRDIKPANVMIGRFGEVYLLDWGLAVTLNREVEYIPSALESRGLVGTPHYIAPEMTVGQGELLCEQTDVYLLGASLYHALVGSPPHRGETLHEVLEFAFEGRARAYPSELPDELRELCERAMAHRAEERFESMEELRLALISYLDHRNSYELSCQAAGRFLLLDQVEESERGALCVEVRFGYQAALNIWPENPLALEGLHSALSRMVELELAQGRVEVAQRLLSELESPSPELVSSVEAATQALEFKRAKLAKLEYDLDESVGLQSRYRFIIVLAITFITSPFLVKAVEGQALPEWLHVITQDATLLMTNLVPFSFAPILIWSRRYTREHLWEHKTSRVFVKGVLLMFIPGVMMRGLSLSGEVPVRYAISAECAVYAASLIQLALSTDRRMGLSSIAYFLTALCLICTSWPPLTVFALGSVAACLGFLSFDAWLRPLEDAITQAQKSK